MIDYAGEYCHAYAAAIEALAAGRDPLEAAKGWVGSSWTVLPIARAASQAARRDFRKPAMQQAAE